MQQFIRGISKISNYGIVRQQSFAFSKAAEIKSVAGHKAPSSEDSPHGRYAAVLFSVASKNEVLHEVNNDMLFLKELSAKSQSFRDFCSNVSLKRTQQRQVIDSIGGSKQFNSITFNFIESLIDNKRVDDLEKCVDKYIEYYKILNKEENIRIISASEVNAEQKKRIETALRQSNQGVTFKLTYEVDPTILGGLQMYSGNTFMDCSLSARVQKIKGELQRLF